jgi:hypothetical protein
VRKSKVEGRAIFVFYWIFMTKFFEAFWGDTWGASLPLPPVWIYEFIFTLKYLELFERSRSKNLWWNG